MKNNLSEDNSVEKILKEVPKFAEGQPPITIGIRPPTEGIVEKLNTIAYRVRPSPRGGVGLFAIRNIQLGESLYLLGANEDWDEYLTDGQYALLTPGVKELVSDYCIHSAGVWVLPNDSFNELAPVYFVNHSKKPNLVTKDEGVTFEALRNIAPGEELTFDYTMYGEDRELGFEVK